MDQGGEIAGKLGIPGLEERYGEFVKFKRREMFAYILFYVLLIMYLLSETISEMISYALAASLFSILFAALIMINYYHMKSREISREAWILRTNRYDILALIPIPVVVLASSCTSMALISSLTREWETWETAIIILSLIPFATYPKLLKMLREPKITLMRVMEKNPLDILPEDCERRGKHAICGNLKVSLSPAGQDEYEVRIEGITSGNINEARRIVEAMKRGTAKSI